MDALLRDENPTALSEQEAATRFRCRYRYCGRMLPRIAIEPELCADGWSFVCPVCSHKSRLINEGGAGLPNRFVQPDEDPPGESIEDGFILL